MESIDMNEVVNDNLVASKQASKQAVTITLTL